MAAGTAELGRHAVRIMLRFCLRVLR